jgi:hypothetical protein
VATLAQRGAGTPVTTSTVGTWATATNAVDGAAGTNPATYAVWTSTGSSAVATIEITGYNFAAIGASDTLNSVTVSVRNLCSATARFSKVEYQAWSGGVALGTIRTGTLATSAHNDSGTFACTVAQLKAADFKVRVTITRAAVTQSATFSIDYADVTADYTAPPPAITQAAYGFFLDTANGERSSPALGRPFTQSTPITRTVAADLNFYLRVRMQSTSADNVPATDDFTLQYEKNASGTWVNATTGGDIVGYLSANLVEGTTVTTERLQNSTADGHDTPGQAWQVNFGGTFRDYGQAFIGDGNTLTGVSLPMRNQSGATGTATFGIYSHNGTYGALNSTPGTLLASATLDVTTIPTGAVTYLMHIPFTGGNQIVLGAGTPYFLTCNFTGSPEISWIATNGPEAVHPGIAIQKYPPVTGSWSAFGQGAYDMIFTIFTNTNPGSGSFVPGKVAEDGVVDDMGWAGNSRTELLYSLRLVYSLLTADATYRFRVLKNGATTDMTYTVTPTLNAVRPKVGTATTTWAYTALTTWLSPVVTMARGVQPPAFSTAGLVSWFDGDTAGSIIQTGATAPKIYGMRDRAGINDQGQSTTNNQPLRQPDLIKAGRSSFYNPADAIARYVNGPTLDSIPAPMNVNQWPFTVIVVLKHDGTAQERSIWSVDQTGGLYWTMLADHRMRLDRQSNGSFLYSSALPANTPLILAATLSSGSEARFYVNGVLDASATVSYPFNAASVARLRFGRGVVSYGDNNGVAWGEGLKWDRVLSDAERQAVESYLADKWTVLPPAPKLWLDAADASTVALSGSTVTQWSDKSGGARHYTGGNAQYTGSIAGQTTVVVSGPAGAMTGPVITTAVDNFAIFVVCRRTGGTVASVPFFNGVGATNGIGPAVRSNDNVNIGFLRGALAWHASTTADDGKTHVHTLTRSTSYGHFVDGIATSLNGIAPGAPNAATVGSYIPASVVGHDFAGDICEIIYYDRALTIAERQKIENYLLGKWFKTAGSATTTWSANPVAVGKEPAKGSAPTTWIMACAASGTKPEVVGPNEGAGTVSWSMSTLGGAGGASDNFNRADANNPGPDWTRCSPAEWAYMSLANNELTSFPSGWQVTYLWKTDPPDITNCFAEIDYWTGGGESRGPVLCHSHDVNDSGACYNLAARVWWPQVTLMRNNAEIVHWNVTPPVNDPDRWVRLRLERVGAELRGYVDSALVGTWVDPSPLTGAGIGWGSLTDNNEGPTRMDNWAGTGAATGGGGAVGEREPEGAGTTAWTMAPTAVGNRAPKAAPVVAYTYNPVAVGKRSPKGAAATGNYTEAVAANGKRVPKATANTGNWTEAVTSVGKRTPKSSVTTTWVEATAAVGYRMSKGSAPSGNFLEVLVVVGKRTPKGTITVAHSWVPAAIGAKPVVGVKQGAGTTSYFYNPTAVGKRAPKAIATTTYTEALAAAGKKIQNSSVGLIWIAATSAAGKRTPKATATATVLQTPAATGKETPKGAGTVTWTYVQFAQGVAPVVGVKQGSGIVYAPFATAAVGKRAPKGGNTTTWTNVTAAAGKKTQKATASTTYTEVVAAVGKRVPKSAPSTIYVEATAAAGKKAPKGTSNVGNHSWTLNAQGSMPLVGYNKGSGIVTNAFATTAVGRRVPKGSRTISNTFNPVATGKKFQKSTVTTSFLWQASAAGKKFPNSAVVLTHVWVLSGAGYEMPEGRGDSDYWFSQVALGLKGITGTVEGIWNGQEVVAMQYGDKPVIDWEMLPA